jgi:hypothetical protein
MEKDYGTVGEMSRDMKKQKAFSNQLSAHSETRSSSLAARFSQYARHRCPHNVFRRVQSILFVVTLNGFYSFVAIGKEFY